MGVCIFRTRKTVVQVRVSCVRERGCACCVGYVVWCVCALCVMSVSCGPSLTFSVSVCVVRGVGGLKGSLCERVVVVVCGGG